MKPNHKEVLEIVKISKDYSLLIKYPDIAKEWHPTKNGNSTPKDIVPGSGKKVWWRCEKGHEWKINIQNRTSCPMCRKGKRSKASCV